MAKKKEENVKAVETEEAKAKFQEKLTASGSCNFFHFFLGF